MIFPEVFTRSNNFLASIKLSSKKARVGVMSNIEKYRAVMRKNRENFQQEIWFPCRGQIQSSYCRNPRGPPAGAGWQETIMRCKPSPTMRCSANITFLINLEKSIARTWHHKTLVWLAPSAQSWNLCHNVILNPRITFVSGDIADDTSASTYIPNIYALTHAHIPNEYRAIKL